MIRVFFGVPESYGNPYWALMGHTGKEREKRRKEGAQPLPLVQFGLGLGGAPNLSSLFPLKPNNAHILPGELP